jgi:hypothetical protein
MYLIVDECSRIQEDVKIYVSMDGKSSGSLFRYGSNISIKALAKTNYTILLVFWPGYLCCANGPIQSAKAINAPCIRTEIRRNLC